MKRSKTAAREYERVRQELDVLLREIREGLDQHAPARPDEILWGHVGDLNHTAERLRDVADQLHQRGEYAKERS